MKVRDMKKKDFFRFLNKLVCIGVVHLKDPNALFYHSGKLIEVNDDSLILETKNGLMLITFDRIKEIKEDR